LKDNTAGPGSYDLNYQTIAKKTAKEEDDFDLPKRYPFNTGQARFEKPKEKRKIGHCKSLTFLKQFPRMKMKMKMTSQDLEHQRIWKVYLSQRSNKSLMLHSYQRY